LLQYATAFHFPAASVCVSQRPVSAQHTKVKSTSRLHIYTLIQAYHLLAHLLQIFLTIE